MKPVMTRYIPRYPQSSNSSCKVDGEAFTHLGSSILIIGFVSLKVALKIGSRNYGVYQPEKEMLLSLPF